MLFGFYIDGAAQSDAGGDHSTFNQSYGHIEKRACTISSNACSIIAQEQEKGKRKRGKYAVSQSAICCG